MGQILLRDAGAIVCHPDDCAFSAAVAAETDLFARVTNRVGNEISEQTLSVLLPDRQNNRVFIKIEGKGQPLLLCLRVLLGDTQGQHLPQVDGLHAALRSAPAHTGQIQDQLKNRTGRNQYSTPRVTSGADSASDPLHSGRITARIVADKNNVSSATVKRCAAFSRAIDLLEQKDSELAKSILAGERRLSQREVIELASMRPSQIRRATFQKPQNEIADGKKDASPVPAHAEPSVKDMPKFDPDGELTALTLTVPSWRESIDRVIAVADIGLVSATAKKRMQAALTELVTSAERLKVLIDCSEEAK